MYMLLFIFSMLFSWYLNKEYFDNSSLQYNIFKFIDSGGAFPVFVCNTCHDRPDIICDDPYKKYFFYISN